MALKLLLTVGSLRTGLINPGFPHTAGQLLQHLMVGSTALDDPGSQS
jgi:hypothetical protein